MHNGPQSTRTHTHKSNPNLSLFHSSGIFAKTEKLCAKKNEEQRQRQYAVTETEIS